MKLVEIDSLPRGEWDARLPAGRATPFHTTEWMRVLQQSYGYTPYGLITETESEWMPVLPMMEITSVLTGRRMVALPFSDACTPLAAGVLRDAFSFLRDTAMRRKWKYIEVRCAEETGESLPRQATYVGHRLSLEASEDALRSGCADGIRRGIRKAEREGVTVREAENEQDLRTFYRLQELTRQRHGLPPQPYRFFRLVRQHFLQPGKGCLLLAECKGTVVAAALFLWTSTTALFKFGASDRRYQDARPNNLLMWAGLLRCRAAGCRELQFGRTDADQDGLRRFKRGWGAAEYDIGYLRYDPVANVFLAGAPDPSGWQMWALGRLPRLAARAVGAMLYRHIG